VVLFVLSFNQQYDIAHGIFITYDTQLDKRLLHSRHKNATRENAKMFFPHQKWEAKTKELFVLSCLYIMFTKTPSSFRALLGELREVDIKDVAQFKHKIINNYDYISKDTQFLKEKYGSSITEQIILKEFIDNNIQFFTAYWFVKLSKGDWVPGRTFTHVMRKLNFIMLFLTFKEDAVDKIRGLFDQFEI